MTDTRFGGHVLYYTLNTTPSQLYGQPWFTTCLKNRRGGEEERCWLIIDLLHVGTMNQCFSCTSKYHTIHRLFPHMPPPAVCFNHFACRLWREVAGESSAEMHQSATFDENFSVTITLLISLPWMLYILISFPQVQGG